MSDNGYVAHNPYIHRDCLACHEPLRLENLYVDDGCPCNSPRGVNFAPQSCTICRTSDCVKPGHRLSQLFGIAPSPVPPPEVGDEPSTMWCCACGAKNNAGWDDCWNCTARQQTFERWLLQTEAAIPRPAAGQKPHAESDNKTPANVTPRPAAGTTLEEDELLPTTTRALFKLGGLVSDCHGAVNTKQGDEAIIAALHALGGYATDIVMKWDRSLQAHLDTQREHLAAALRAAPPTTEWDGSDEAAWSLIEATANDSIESPRGNPWPAGMCVWAAQLHYAIEGVGRLGDFLRRHRAATPSEDARDDTSIVSIQRAAFIRGALLERVPYNEAEAKAMRLFPTNAERAAMQSARPDTRGPSDG